MDLLQLSDRQQRMSHMFLTQSYYALAELMYTLAREDFETLTRLMEAGGDASEDQHTKISSCGGNDK